MSRNESDIRKCIWTWVATITLTGVALSFFEAWSHFGLNRPSQQAAKLPFIVGFTAALGCVEWLRARWLDDTWRGRGIYVAGSAALLHVVTPAAFVWGTMSFEGWGWYGRLIADDGFVWAIWYAHALAPFVLGGWALGVIWTGSRLLVQVGLRVFGGAEGQS